jgi:hypothetical protein
MEKELQQLIEIYVEISVKFQGQIAAVKKPCTGGPCYTFER